MTLMGREDHAPFIAFFIDPEDSPEQKRAHDACVLSILEDGYRINYLGGREEEMLGVPDVDGQIVAMALRVYLLPADPIATICSPDSLSLSMHNTRTFFG